MAKCDWCNREMTTADGCKTETVEFPDGTILASIRYEHDFSDRCGDCNVKRGEYHHPGCDLEECPKCHGQLISCGCLETDDEDE